MIEKKRNINIVQFASLFPKHMNGSYQLANLYVQRAIKITYWRQEADLCALWVMCHLVHKGEGSMHRSSTRAEGQYFEHDLMAHSDLWPLSKRATWGTDIHLTFSVSPPVGEIHWAGTKWRVFSTVPHHHHLRNSNTHLLQNVLAFLVVADQRLIAFFIWDVGRVFLDVCTAGTPQQETQTHCTTRKRNDYLCIRAQAASTLQI